MKRLFKSNIWMFILSVISLLPFVMKLDIIPDEEIMAVTTINNKIIKAIVNIRLSVTSPGILYFLLLIIFFNMYCFIQRKKDSINKHALCMSIIYSLIMIVGYSYNQNGNWDIIFSSHVQFIKCFICGVGYAILFYMFLVFVMDVLGNITKQYTTSGMKQYKKQERYIIFGIIFITYLIYLIVMYPGMIDGDVWVQIEQWLGKKEWTNHHPFINVVLVGSIIELGKWIGNGTLGLFIYNFIQIFIVSIVIEHLLKFFLDIGINKKIVRIILLYYILVPIYPMYFISLGKNTLYSIVYLVFAMLIYKVLFQEETFWENKKQIAFLIGISCLLAMIRQNGIYAVIVTGCMLILLIKKYRKVVLVVLFNVLLVFTVYCVIVKNVFGIPDGSKREALSMIFQPTARCAIEHDDTITYEEKEIINKVLDYEAIKLGYVYDLSDNVKGTYKEPEKEEFTAYMKVWMKQFIRYPTTYLQAWIAMGYGVFYVDRQKYDYAFLKNFNSEACADVGWNYYGGYGVRQEFCRQIYYGFQLIPGIGIVRQVGFATWMLIFVTGYSLYKKKYRYTCFLIIYWINVLVTIVSPQSANFNYSAPLTTALPIFIVMLLKIGDKNE